MIEVNTPFIRMIQFLTGLDTQKAVAEFIGVDPSTFSRWCNGESIPLQKIDLMCKKFHLAFAWFFRVVGEEPKYEKEPHIFEHWIPITYRFPMFKHEIIWRINSGDSIEETGVSLERIDNFESLGTDVDPNLTAQEFAALVNATHINPNSCIEDDNCKFLEDPDCYTYTLYKEARAEIDSLRKDKKVQKEQINNNNKQISEQAEAIDSYRKIMSRQQQLIGMAKEDPAKPQLINDIKDLYKQHFDWQKRQEKRFVIELKLRIKELAEDQSKDKLRSLDELYYADWDKILGLDTNKEAN